jgi:hypothetical protein
MKEYIAKLREKPEPVKKQIALWGAIIGGGLVFLFWIATLSFTTKQADADKTLSPISALKETAQNAYNQIQVDASGIQNPFAKNQQAKPPEIIPEPTADVTPETTSLTLPDTTQTDSSISN